MFVPFETWRHRNCTEIDMYVVSVRYQWPEYVKMKVFYINRQAFSPENKILNTRADSVKVLRKHFKNWKLVTPYELI